MGATWRIAAKDLRLQLRNRSLLVLGLLAPLALSFVLDLVFGGIEEEGGITFDVGLVAPDDDGPAAGFTALVDELAATGLLDVREYPDEAAARAAVDDGDVAAAWVVPEDFSAAVQAGRGTAITVVGDVDSPNTAGAARSIAQGYATRLGTATLAGLVAVETGVAGPGGVATVAEQVAASPPLAALSSRDLASTQLDATTSLSAGLALFFVFFTAGTAVLGIIEERGGGTLARLLAAPIPRASIVAGKVVAAVVLGVLSLVSLMVGSTLLMGADWGPPVGAVLLALCAVLAATGIMAVAGSAARTTEQAGGVQGVVAVVLAVVGGTFVPIPASEGSLLSTLRALTPNGQYLDGLTALRADGPVAALPHAAALAAMGLVAGAVGVRVVAGRLWR
ncbi:MAG: ABC transporter permease [Acidimicrobiia bacterium]